MNRSDTEILRLDGLWQRHRIWKKKLYSLKTALIHGLRGHRQSYEDFWALKDISFSVARGEALGFCGPNGAGKSTLLKVIARILPPTHGRITVRGRIATLFELGAGFLPDLTGRENIVLNGAILGYGTDEIRRRMDEIVDFADLGEFIDSPVRMYSAGMYMRLGFAIASHIDADILLLDEVLAVGDAGFQQKCRAWLQDLRRRGTTVLVVSHVIPTLVEMCDRVIWLDQGRARACGPPAEVVDRYRRQQESGHPIAAEGSDR